MPGLREIARLLCLAIALVCVVSGSTGQSLAQSGSALVIGNAAYSFAPLANPGNDAGDVAKTLREAGFGVTLLVDGDRASMLESIDQFSEN